MDIVGICKITHAVNKFVDKKQIFFGQGWAKASSLQGLFILLISIHSLWISRLINILFELAILLLNESDLGYKEEK